MLLEQKETTEPKLFSSCSARTKFKLYPWPIIYRLRLIRYRMTQEKHEHY